MYVYQITNNINNKIYIGITNNYQKRWSNEKCLPKDPKRQQVIQLAIHKYGAENFSFEVLYSGLSIEEASEKEEQLIFEKNCRVPNGYNIDKGGFYGHGTPLPGEKNGMSILTDQEVQYIKSHRNIPMYVLYDDFSNKITYSTFKQIYKNQSHLHIQPTVPEYPYNFEFSLQFSSMNKIDYGDVEKLRNQYNQKVYWKDAYQDYKDIYSEEAFWQVYNGTRFSLVMPEVFTEENKKYHASIGKRGEGNPKSKLKVEDVIKIRELHENGVSNQDIYELFPQVTPTSIRNIINKVTWKHLL